jgi:hypothetical protein
LLWDRPPGLSSFCVTPAAYPHCSPVFLAGPCKSPAHIEGGDIRTHRGSRAHRIAGYHIVESGPTDAERMRYPKLASLNGGEAEEAFRTEPESPDAMEVTHAMGRMLDA